MTITEMLQQSVILTLLGMAIVFVFLWLMIICINAAGKLVRGMGWDKDVRQPGNETKKNPGGAARPELSAAISAAITEYRNKK